MHRETVGMAAILLVASAVAIQSQGSRPAKSGIEVREDHIEFLVDGKSVARYVTGPNIAKPYFWPMLGPGGERLTRAWPMERGAPGESTDHVHQKSAWFCHGDVI